MTDANAIAMTGIGKVAFVKTQVPELQPGELLIRTEVSAVSRGTELRCLAGQQPNSVDFPFIPGYSLVGIVEQSAADGGVAVGTRVFCTGTKFAGINLQWGSHISFAVTDANRVIPIPDGCSAKSAAFTKMVAIALRGSQIAQPRPSDNVAVVGLGPIGLLSARLFKAAGTNVLGLDQETSRVELAKSGKLAATVVTETIEKTVRSHFGVGADIVVDATGTPAVLPHSMRAAKDLAWDDNTVTGSKLVIQGSYPDQFSLPYQEAFRKELHIIMPRDCTPANLVQAMDLIANGSCHVDDLISWFGAPSAASEAYDLLRSERSVMTVAFDWSA